MCHVLEQVFILVVVLFVFVVFFIIFGCFSELLDELFVTVDLFAEFFVLVIVSGGVKKMVS